MLADTVIYCAYVMAKLNSNNLWMLNRYQPVAKVLSIIHTHKPGNTLRDTLVRSKCFTLIGRVIGVIDSLLTVSLFLVFESYGPRALAGRVILGLKTSHLVQLYIPYGNVNLVTTLYFS